MKPRHQMAVFGFFFFLYMLSTSREIPWNDAKLIFYTAESIVFRGELGIPAGPGIYSYAPHPILASLAHVPGVMIYKWIVDRWLGAWSMAKVITCHTGPAFFGALTCVLFLNTCLRLGVRRGVASLGTLLLGLGTFVWVYARSPYSEIVQAATFMGYVGSLVAFGEAPRRGTAFRVGFWAALLLNSKLVFALALPGGLVFCLYRLRRDVKRFLSLVPVALAPLAVGALTIALHNRARLGPVAPSGGMASTGYTVDATVFAQPLWEGVWGLLASPGRSLLLYAPPLVLAVFAARRVWRLQPRVLGVLVITVTPVFFLYAKYESWSGDWAWGPRYMVPLVAPLLLPGVVYLDEVLQAGRWVKRAWATLLVTLFGASFLVQVIGNAFYWDHFIRISQEARNNWLGDPNRSGSRGVRRPVGCDPCFEDFYPFQWLPAFQPIQGHYWLLKTVPFKTPWPEATLTAPWSRYTNLSVPIARSYPQVRVDWWLLQFWKPFRKASLILLVVLSAGTALSGAAWAWACRKPRARFSSLPPV